MPKEIIIENYYSAYEIMTGQWVRIDPCDYYEENESGCPLHANNQFTLDLLLKEERWKELSEEAKEMINAILHCPSEILELITTPKNGKLTKRSIRKYFNIKWRSKLFTDLAIREIIGWVNKL